MDTELMKRKLDDEEYQALLNVFDGQKVSFRKTENGSAKVCHGSGVIISLRAT
jgi:hypothetical protein